MAIEVPGECGSTGAWRVWLYRWAIVRVPSRPARQSSMLAPPHSTARVRARRAQSRAASSSRSVTRRDPYPSQYHYPSHYPSQYPSFSPSQYPSQYPSRSPSQYPSRSAGQIRVGDLRSRAASRACASGQHVACPSESQSQTRAPRILFRIDPSLHPSQILRPVRRRNPRSHASLYPSLYPIRSVPDRLRSGTEPRLHYLSHVPSGPLSGLDSLVAPSF